MPTRLAARKWPSSWTNTSTPSTKTNARTCQSRHGTSDLQFYPAGDLRRILARPLRPRRAPRPASPPRPARCASIVRSMTRGNRRESRAGRRETARPRFRWRRSARPAGSARPRAPDTPGAGTGNASVSGASNSSAPARARSSDGSAAGQRSGIRKRILNRQPHVGDAELRDHRAVGQLDHRVHDRLRMDDDVDLDRRRRRTASAPRSPRGPCSSASPNRW